MVCWLLDWMVSNPEERERNCSPGLFLYLDMRYRRRCRFQQLDLLLA